MKRMMKPRKKAKYIAHKLCCLKAPQEEEEEVEWKWEDMKKWNHHKNHLKNGMKQEKRKENYNFINRWIKGDMAHGMHLS